MDYILQVAELNYQIHCAVLVEEVLGRHARRVDEDGMKEVGEVSQREKIVPLFGSVIVYASPSSASYQI